MKKKHIIYVALAIFGIAMGCTNDEGEQDIDIITPKEENQKADYED